MEQAILEKELVVDCCKGNEQAQFQLYERYSKAMYNICLRMMGDIGTAEDLLQESFIDVFNKMNSYRYESTLGAWVKKIVINNCISTLRKKKIKFDEMDEQIFNVPESNEVKEDSMYQVSQIKEAMTNLSDGYRTITSLYAFEGYDHNEIAEILNISASTSKSQYHRAKEKIRMYISTHN